MLLIGLKTKVKSDRQLSAGFTLIEVMIVLTIIAVLSSVAMPSFKGVAASHRLKASAKGIRDLCYFARNMAITEQSGFFVVLDMDQNRYWLADVETLNQQFRANTGQNMSLVEPSQVSQQVATLQTESVLNTSQPTATRAGILIGQPQQLNDSVQFSSLDIKHNITQIESSNLQTGQGYIYFSPNGTASQAEIVLQSQNSTVGAVSEEQKPTILIQIEHATARIKLERISAEMLERNSS
tara:strand:- start:1087 stop:1803 length:717 start_codon:yes stop_codon:yes gene_type:complete